MSLISAFFRTNIKVQLDVNERDGKHINRDDEIESWQGRWDLHQWLEDIYEDKGGKCGEYADNSRCERFNGMSLEITENILDRWELICVDYQHIPMYFDEERDYLDEDIRTIAKCREILKKGEYIFYWPAY